MSRKFPLIETLAFGMLLVLAGCTGKTRDASDAVPPTNAALEAVPLVNHIQFGVFEMDGFIDRGDGEGIYRATAANASSPALRDAVLYRTGARVPHDPTFTLVGPFPKGEATTVKLSDWLAARGSVAYACEADHATFDAALAKLIPNGLYTFWYARLTLNAGVITGAAEYALGAMDGSQNTFTADAQGAAKFHLADFPCVEPASVDGTGTGVATVFAVAWHSDGVTHGASPGDFGSQTHVQLFGMAIAARSA